MPIIIAKAQYNYKAAISLNAKVLKGAGDRRISFQRILKWPEFRQSLWLVAEPQSP